MDGCESEHLAIVAKMVREPVVGSRHVQPQTLLKWCGEYEGDVLKAAIDDLTTDRNAPVVKKSRGTITLRSVHEAKEFIEEHDDDNEFTWYL